MKNLFKTAVIILLIASLLYSIVPVFADTDLNDFPRLDDHYRVTCPDEDAIMAKARAGNVSTAYDLRVAANVEELGDAGWSVSTNIGYGFHYIGMNCRDVCPDTAGEIQDIGRLPGDSLFPMNVPQFRFALHLIVGGEIMDRIVSEVFGWTQVRMDTIPSPAGAPYYNPELVCPHDEAAALQLLADVGITHTTGIWRNDNPDIGPVGEIRNPANPYGWDNPMIGVLGCPEAVLSTSLVSMKCVDEWNRFFGLNSVGNPYFYYFEYPWVTMADMVFIQRDHDMAGLGWSVGRDPDYLYTFFHSSKIGYDDYNWPGYSDPITDELLYALKYWRWTNGTPITTVAEMIPIAFEAQERIFYHTPYLIDYCTVCPNAYAPGVKCWQENLGYGSMTAWTDCLIHWEDLTKQGMNISNPGPPGNFNPAESGTVYEWEVLSLIYDGFLVIDADYHEDLMWAVENYVVEPYSNVAEGVEYGQNVTFTLREGITWHDGSPFTADDALFSYELIANLELPRFSEVYTTYIRSEKITDYEFRVYMDCTGMWFVYDYAGCAMLFHEDVWTPWLDDTVGAKAWEPWTKDYDEWMFENYGITTDTGDLTCLIGTGPYVFVEWNKVAGVVWLKANRPFTIDDWTYTGSYWLPFENVTDLIRSGDFDRDRDVDRDDYWHFCGAFIDYYKTGTLDQPSDFDIDSDIDRTDLWTFCDRFIQYYKGQP